MTEEIAATPGWTDDRLDRVFAALPASPAVSAGRTAYEICLAARKAPAAPSDMLGAEFEPCHRALHRALREAGVDPSTLERLESELEALEAEIAAGS